MVGEGLAVFASPRGLESEQMGINATHGLQFKPQNTHGGCVDEHDGTLLSRKLPSFPGQSIITNGIISNVRVDIQCQQ